MFPLIRIALGAVLGTQLAAGSGHELSQTTLAFRFPDGKKMNVEVAGTAAAPMVKGTAEVEYREGRSTIKLSVDKLPDPRSVGAFNTTYVAWVIRGDEVVERLAEIPVRKEDILGSTPARMFGLIITAEPYATVKLPSPVVVADLNASDRPDPTLQSSLINYSGDTGNLYQGLSDASATPDSVTPLVVLGARRSVAIARKAHADRYAQAEVGMAAGRLDSLESAWSKNPKDEQRYSELARETMRLAEVARRLATDRGEQARQLAKLEQQALDSASRGAALARADKDRETQSRVDVETQAGEVQARLFRSVSTFLETRQEPRGMIATLAGVSFQKNKATLKPVAREKLSKLSGVLLGYPGDYKLAIEGHTDSVGSDLQNQKLSLARAKSVRDYFVLQGIPTERISSTEGLGRTSPAAPNDTPANREKNRRVDIVIEQGSR
ncbi:MAG TPA: OmpA family protein [Gemmatimonadales bacterium]|nr:OmpA family protein [Gemmatimonadales bacterium]